MILLHAASFELSNPLSLGAVLLGKIETCDKGYSISTQPHGPYARKAPSRLTARMSGSRG